MEHILTLILFFPLFAAIFAFFIDEKSIRAYAIFMSFIEFALTMILWLKFEGFLGADISKLTDTILFFIPSLGIHYYVGVDGISLFLVILSSFMTFLALISLNITDRLKHLIIAILFLETTMIGVFLSLDAIFFYIFWELSLIPMLYIIGAWGSGKRIYAAVKFFLYTFAGSVFLLLGIIVMAYLNYKQTGIYSFSIADWRELNLPFNIQIWLFIAFSLAFAIKTPLFPFHTWLPYAHGQAPTIGSVLLAAVLLKMGTYGFVRFSLPLFPDASVYFADFFSIIAVIMVIYTSFVAFGQKDIKQVIAYSSVAHMGIIMLGIFSMSIEGISGSIFLMVSHGIVSGGLFMLVGFIYDRRHTKEMSEFGGLAKVMPNYAFIFALTIFASIGLPLTIGFVGEFLSLLGAFKLSIWYAFLGGLGIIMGAIYSLNLYKRTFFGELNNPKNMELKDLNKTELFAIVPICILIILLGVFPDLMLKHIDVSVKSELYRIHEKSNDISKAKLDDINLLKVKYERN